MSDLLSRSTLASSRAIVVCAGAVILKEYLHFDMSGFNLLGVNLTEYQLSASSIWALTFLWIALVVNWTLDAQRLGHWNQSYSSQRVETIMDGGGQIKGQIHFIIGYLENAVSKNELGKEDLRTVEECMRQLREIKRSLWYFNSAAFAYVLGWGLFVPTVTFVWAVWLLLE